MSWRDDRIKLLKSHQTNVGIYSENGKNIWIPSLFINGVLQTKKIEISSKYGVFLSEKDEKTYLRRSFAIEVTLRCNMYFDYFPFDTQTCEIGFLNEYTYCNDIMNITRKEHSVLDFMVI